MASYCKNPRPFRTGRVSTQEAREELDMLKDSGRCGVVVHEGVLFGSTKAHKELRRRLVANNNVEAVLSLPGGVFNPYSGVKTSVLVFRKGGATDRVIFPHAENDGFKLDANHDQPTRETIAEAGLRESSARMVSAGTVLLTSRATIGYTAASPLGERACWPPGPGSPDQPVGLANVRNPSQGIEEA